MADVGVLDQLDNDAAVAPLPAAPVIETAPVNPFEEVAGPAPDDINNIVPIDTAAQVTTPAQTADPLLPTYDATTKELTEDQLVSGNLDKILDKGGVLMDVARSAGDEYSNSRGMLNSSMGAEASMRSMIDTALPIAQQDASAQLSQLQTNQNYQNVADQFNATNQVQQTRDSILQSYQLQMENLSTNNKAMLIDLEQRYAASIQSDKNASDVYVQTINSIADLMSNADMTVAQQQSGMNELVGMLDAYLDFNLNLTSVDSITGKITDGVDTTGTVATDRVDQTALSDQLSEVEKEAKLSEYYQKLSALERTAPPETVDYRAGSRILQKENPDYTAWLVEKDNLVAEYAQWLR